MFWGDPFLRFSVLLLIRGSVLLSIYGLHGILVAIVIICNCFKSSVVTLLYSVIFCVNRSLDETEVLIGFSWEQWGSKAAQKCAFVHYIL